jgi:hypothetical protein
MDETFAPWWTRIVFSMIVLKGIRITSIGKNDNDCAVHAHDGEDNDPIKILIKLDIAEDSVDEMTDEERFQGINKFIFNSKPADKKDGKLEAKFDSGVAKWKVHRSGVVDVQWKERKARGAQIFRHLTRSLNSPYFEEEDLD